jgi:hypothetical protein
MKEKLVEKVIIVPAPLPATSPQPSSTPQPSLQVDPAKEVLELRRTVDEMKGQIIPTVTPQAR